MIGPIAVNLLMINENTVGIIAQLVNHDLESMNRLILACILHSCRV